MGNTGLKPKTEITVKNIAGFIERKITPFGTGAKVGVPKEYLGHKAYLVICKKTGTKKPSKPKKNQ